MSLSAECKSNKELFIHIVLVNSKPVSTGRGPSEKKPRKFLAGIEMAGEFVGRKSDLERLDNLLKGPNHHITIHGFGGIGKTALALEVVQRFDAGKVLAIPLFGIPKLTDVVRKIARFLHTDVDILPNCEDKK